MDQNRVKDGAPESLEYAELIAAIQWQWGVVKNTRVRSKRNPKVRMWSLLDELMRRQ